MEENSLYSIHIQRPWHQCHSLAYFSVAGPQVLSLQITPLLRDKALRKGISDIRRERRWPSFPHARLVWAGFQGVPTDLCPSHSRTENLQRPASQGREVDQNKLPFSLFQESHLALPLRSKSPGRSATREGQTGDLLQVLMESFISRLPDPSGFPHALAVP